MATQKKEATEDKAIQSQEEDPFAEDEDDQPLSQSILGSGHKSRRELFQKKEITVHTSTRAQIIKDFDDENPVLVIDSGSEDSDEFLPVTQLPGQKTPPR